ncbi:CAAX prenyl protease-like protein [Naumannella halotolerans]|uniref:CAAX prenyl protease-like protein n=1 Tax=Naumannella halotolerans TaxID=993414 RepID=A0A4R7J160_9ACTN|nr:CAAX prenyl protease-like protein [Naumannella halotolerans]
MVVLALSLGRSAVYSVLNLIEKLTRPEALSSQTTSMNSSITPDRPWLDLSYQLAQILFGVAPAALAVYLLLFRAGPMLWGRSPFAALGLDLRRPGFDLSRGAVLLAVIGIPGIGIYLGARALGLNTTIAAANLAENWWTIPVLVLAALEASLLEEIVIAGYFLIRLTQLGWSWWQMVLLSALIRGSYHLYQGVGQGIANFLMGLVFGLLFLRWKRVGPLIVVHLLLDVFSFVGYALLAPVVDWL